MKKIVGEKLTRAVNIGAVVDEDERTVEVSLSSEYPVPRWDGDEVLIHENEAIDMSRFPLPLCVAHETYRGVNIGLIENPKIVDKKLRATLRFGERQEANDYWTDIKNGIIRNISIGYQIQATDDQDKSTYRVTRWLPFEASLVSVPADPTVGVGRSLEEKTKTTGKNIMEEEIKVGEGLTDADRAAFISEGPGSQPPVEADTAPTGIRLYKHGEALPTKTVDPDQSNLDLGRFLKGITTGNWNGGERERRTMAVGTDSLGGYLLPSPMSSRIIDLARNQSVLVRAGALTLPMETSTLKLAKITQDATGYWRAENAAITESDMGFGALNLSCKVLAALCRVSIELIEDTPNVGQLIESSIGSALALELDRVGLFGIGAGSEPLGLFGTSGIETEDMGTNGAHLASYDKFSNAVTTLLGNNAEPTTAIFAPRTAGVLDLLKDGEARPLVPPPSFQKLTKLVSNQVPINQTHGTAENASCALVGDFSNMVIGMRQQVILEASRFADANTFSKMQVLIRGYLRADIGIMRADHFNIITGITTS